MDGERKEKDEWRENWKRETVEYSGSKEDGGEMEGKKGSEQ